jgi:hypothetical protein
VPIFEFAGSDPIDHFRLGRVSPGDTAEFDKQPAGPWKPSRKKRPTTEPVSDDPTTEKEG